MFDICLRTSAACQTLIWRHARPLLYARYETESPESRSRKLAASQWKRFASDPCSVLAGACRNRTYQSPCDDLIDFEDRASHQTRTLP
jgi:hypothetical protein